jgi:hypothetical protein
MPLSQGVLEIPTKSEKLTKPEVAFATNVVTDYPLETHVFASMLHNLPLYIGTKRGVWLIDRNKIFFVSDKAPE